MLRVEAIRAGLARFHGTEQLHRYLFLDYTDGVAWLAKNADCHWLIDIVMSYQNEPAVRALGQFQFWTLKMTGPHSGVVTCVEDKGVPPVVTQEITLTDFPLPEGIDLWVDTSQGRPVVMLPSEY